MIIFSQNVGHILQQTVTKPIIFLFNGKCLKKHGEKNTRCIVQLDLKYYLTEMSPLIKNCRAFNTRMLILFYSNEAFNDTL